MPKKGNEETKERKRRSVSGSKYEAPKRSKTAYLIFSIDKRPEYQAENPEIKGKDMMRYIGAQWKALPDAEKRKYELEAERDKERFDRQMEEYKETGYYHDEEGRPVKNIKTSGASARRKSATPPARPKKASLPKKPAKVGKTGKADVKPRGKKG